jgi:DNA-binding MarR family transcriptional regulator
VDDDPAFYEQLDRALTSFVRLARHPKMAQQMAPGIDPSVDPRLLVLLNLIADRGPVRAADLVEVLAVDQSTVSRQLAALEGHGLVQRSVDPRDRRAALVEVTAEGQQAMHLARVAWQRTLADITAGWSDERKVALLRSVHDLVDGLAAIVPHAGVGPSAPAPTSST